MAEASETPKTSRISGCFFPLGLLALFGCCGGGIFGLDDRPFTESRIKNLEKDLEKSLPYGSTWEEARAWFVSRGMEPTEIFQIADNRKTGLQGKRPSGGLFNLAQAEIVVQVDFTPEGKLWKRRVYRFGSSF